jgi:signal transduction histidine kinase
LLLALCLVGDAVAILCLHGSTRRLGSLVESHRIQSMRETLTSAGLRVEVDVLTHLAGLERDEQRRIDNQRRLEETLGQCGGCHHQPAVQAKLDGIRDALEAYQTAADRLFSNNNSENAHVSEKEVSELGHVLVQAATKTADEASRHLTVRSANAAASVRTARMVLFATLGAVLVFGGIVAFHLKRRLTTPVEALLRGIERVREGNLPHPSPIDADEEFRLLADAYNKAYQDLRQAQDSILQAEKLAAVGQLAAGIAHEVLNPLASVSSVVQIMRSRCDSDEQTKQFDLIVKEIQRAAKVLRELQVFSRAPATELRSRVRIDEVLEHATTLVGYDRRARNLTITCRRDPQLRPVTGDPDRLLLVFTNIMFNALDAMSTRDRDSGKLEITARQQRESVVVEFRDSGPGMTEEQIARAFEPFFTTKGPQAGTGLGLWICYQVISGHRGTINIESRVGEGTTVAVKLPCEPADPG